jgi:hypothetical protein
MSDDLIGRLAADVRPVPRGALGSRLLGALAVSVVVSAILMTLWIGLRGDIATAWLDPIFWVKFGYALLLALGGFVAAERLARPGGSMRGAAIAIVATFVAAGVLGIAQLLLSPPEMARTLVIGGTALVCPFYIMAISAPIFAATIAVMRRLAPTNLPLAGLAAGLLSGGAGAWIYAFHCGENGLPFLAIWYTLGVFTVAAIGALTGRWLLRW